MIAGILGYGRSRHLFYVYFVLKCVTSTVCEGSVQCLAIAYAVRFSPTSADLVCLFLFNLNFYKDCSINVSSKCLKRVQS